MTDTTISTGTMPTLEPVRNTFATVERSKGQSVILIAAGAGVGALLLGVAVVVLLRVSIKR